MKGLLTTEKWYEPVSKMSLHMKKGVEGRGMEHEMFENSGSVLPNLRGPSSTKL